MALDAAQLDATFGTGFSSVKSITGWSARALNMPALPVANAGDDVSEQQIAVSARFNGATGALTIAPDANGHGVWIPYLGNGTGKAGAKGWGTYTKAITNETWVATGPFSGCYVGHFKGAGVRFAHLITPAAGYKAASVDGQIASIEKATATKLADKWPMEGAALGLAFFMKISGRWYRRFVWVAPGTGGVSQMNSKSTEI